MRGRSHMIQDANNGVLDLFNASSRNWTPLSVNHVACVLYAPLSHDPEISKRCGSILSDAERQKADRFITEGGRVRFIQRRAFRRYCAALAFGSRQPLSQIAFDETDKGQPYISDRPDLWFSFSSCRFGVVGAWSSTHAIGIDIEDQTKNIEVAELARQFFSTAEVKAVDGLRNESGPTFFQLWSLKEAALKSIGEGLPFGLDAFEFELDPILRITQAPREYGGPMQFNAYTIGGPTGCSALVTRSLP